MNFPRAGHELFPSLVTRSGTATKSSFQDRLPFMKVRSNGPRGVENPLTIDFPSSPTSDEIVLESRTAHIPTRPSTAGRLKAPTRTPTALIASRRGYVVFLLLY